MPMFNRIAVAVDGSPTSSLGLATAIQLAHDQQAELVILHVIGDALPSVAAESDATLPRAYREAIAARLREHGGKILAKAQAAAKKAQVNARSSLVVMRARTVAEAIVAEARKQRAELIVLGTHGRRGLRRMVMGSDAEEVVREARVPVMLVRDMGAPTSRKPAGKRAATRPAAAGETTSTVP